MSTLFIGLFKLPAFILPKLKLIKFFENKFLAAAAGFKYFFPTVWLIIFIAWIPCFMAEFPGVLAYDSSQQFLEGVIFKINSNHQPIFHTLLFSIFCELSYTLFGNFIVGTAVYTIAQMLLLSYAFARLCDYLRRKNIPFIVVMVVILGFALIPSNAVLAVNMTKDVPFTAFFILFMINICKVVLESDEFFAKRSNLIRLVLIAFFMSAFRNQGIYIAMLTLPGLIMLKGLRLKCLIMTASLALLWFIYTGPVFAFLNVVPGMVQERLSVPLQGLSRVMVYRGDDLSDAEKNLIAAYLPDYQLYAPKISDPVKFTFNQELYHQSPMDFYKLWLQIGAKFPYEYINSFLINTSGYWYIFYDYSIEARHMPYISLYSSSTDPDALIRYIRLLWRNQDVDFDVMLNEPERMKRLELLAPTFERSTNFPRIHHFYHRFSESALYQRIPFAALFMSPAYCFIYLLLIFSYSLYSKKYRFLYILLPPALLFSTLLLGPVSLMRYAYPIMCSLPLFLLLFQLKRK